MLPCPDELSINFFTTVFRSSAMVSPLNKGTKWVFIKYSVTTKYSRSLQDMREKNFPSIFISLSFGFNPITRYSGLIPSSSTSFKNSLQLVASLFNNVSKTSGGNWTIWIVLDVGEYLGSVHRVTFIRVNYRWVDHVGHVKALTQRQFMPFRAKVLYLLRSRPCVI